MSATVTLPWGHGRHKVTVQKHEDEQHGISVDRTSSGTLVRVSTNTILAAVISLLGIFVGVLGMWMTSQSADVAAIKIENARQSEQIIKNTTIIANLLAQNAKAEVWAEKFEIKLDEIRKAQIRHYDISEDNNDALRRRKK